MKKLDLSRDFFLVAKTGSNLKIWARGIFQWSKIKILKKQAGSWFDFWWK